MYGPSLFVCLPMVNGTAHGDDPFLGGHAASSRNDEPHRCFETIADGTDDALDGVHLALGEREVALNSGDLLNTEASTMFTAAAGGAGCAS